MVAESHRGLVVIHQLDTMIALYGPTFIVICVLRYSNVEQSDHAGIVRPLIIICSPSV